MSEVWTQWEGEVVNGVFPLRRLLRASDHSAVFLTACAAQNLPDAAIKLVPAVPTLTLAQFSHWTSTALSHPHLIRLLETGLCRIGGRQFLYVAMEYAEQTLSQLLAQRALTPEEVREMLTPTLSALAFLHRNNLVLGQLKPSNVLVVQDQLKLASDAVRPAGHSTAGDIRALGATLVEALTQHPPSWPVGESEIAVLRAALAPGLADIVSRCLNPDPASRPTAAQLEAEINPTPSTPPTPSIPREPPVSAPESPALIARPYAQARNTAVVPKWRERRLPVLAIAVPFVAAVAVWAGFRLLDSRDSSQRAAPIATAPQGSPTLVSATPAAAPLSNSPPSVLHEEIPDVPQSARGTIRGRIKIAVRVTVDDSGNVVREALQTPGPSRYFARLATDAARKWKFVPAENPDVRKWLLRFEFTREGATGHAAASRS